MGSGFISGPFTLGDNAYQVQSVTYSTVPPYGPQLVFPHRPSRVTLLVFWGQQFNTTFTDSAWFLGGPPGIGMKFGVSLVNPGQQALKITEFTRLTLPELLSGEVWINNNSATQGLYIGMTEVWCPC